MKPYALYILLSFFLITGQAYSQDPGVIAGKWLKTPKEDLIIEVYKFENEYRGKITWSKDTAGNKQVGFLILEGLKYNGKKKIWSDGKVRNPLSGNIYNATAKIRTDGTLEVLAYRGMKFIGRKKYFKRVK